MYKTQASFKFLALFLLLLAFGLSSGRVDATHETSETPFPSSGSFADVPGVHPYEDAIQYLRDQKIIEGYPGGKYIPENTITRAEFVKIIVAAREANPTGSNCFTDVQNQWFAKYVCTAKKKGILQGYSDGTFQPNQNISIVEGSKIITKGFGLGVKKAGTSDPWYKPFVTTLEGKKAIPVTIDYPSEKVSRAEMAEIVYRLKAKVTNKSAKTYTALVSEFPEISSCAELKDKFVAANYKNQYSYRTYALEKSSDEEAAPSAAAEGAEGAEGGGGAGDYSQTNVQVEGVDEADVIKNDGSHIYLLKGRSVRIVKATPPDTMSEVTKITFDDKNFWPNDLYISANQLVVLGNSSGAPDYRSRTKVFIYGISNRAAPSKEREVAFDGSMVSSRRIGNMVYLVMNDYPLYHILKPETPAEDLLPHIHDSMGNVNEPVVPCDDVNFYPRYNDINYLMVASVPLSGGATSEIKREMFMGGGQTVYGSKEGIYVATERHDYNEQVKYSIWFPEIQNTNTVLYRFALSGGNIEYKGQGQVPGRLLNQWSMDERGETFRVATTVGDVWSRTQLSTNNIYILDRNDLQKVLGKKEGIAPGERIYSVRFMGDRAYLVTFKKVDPFFVIDLSDSSNPKILGELKIPGYSDYLHPFDENHIIGFGKDAVDPTELDKAGFNNDAFDFAWYQGMKIALFDVTDVQNPKVLFQEVIGDRGTESELLYNHKALLYDKARNLFAFPVTVAEIKDKTSGSYTGSQYGKTIFQGAYVYTLNLTDGFQLKGKITHHTDSSAFENYYSYYNDDNAIRRVLYIGDFLYSVSPGSVKATERATMTEKKTLELEKDPNDQPIYYDY